MFVFFHGYSPDTWEGTQKHHLMREGDGLRVVQSIMQTPDMHFNALAKKGGALYEIIREKNCPMYMDRIQGGINIFDYPYDRALIADYQAMLGDKFYGFQMHEWLSNYRTDLHKLGNLSAEDWTEENIIKTINDQFGGMFLFLESMTAKEMEQAGKAETFAHFFKNMTDIFKKRMEIAPLLPADSGFITTQFALSCGVKRIMPEIGGQIPYTRLQLCYARGMMQGEGRSFGAYYEPWGGGVFSACMYNSSGKNEWGLKAEHGFPFETAGPNGGSSRSLQKRIFHYAYLSGAQFISEEWGLYNTFMDLEDFALSPYGKVKKDFLAFVDRYKDIGKKLAPIAAVIPEEMQVYDLWWDTPGFDLHCGFPSPFPYIREVKEAIAALFLDAAPAIGIETNIMHNSIIPDAIDMLNRDDRLLRQYDYLVDLTQSADFKNKFKNTCEISDVPSLLKKLLPCYVEGTLHWMVNERKGGGYYLSVFNNSGVTRTLQDGESTLPEAEATVYVTFKNDAVPTLLEGCASLQKDGDGYRLTVAPGEFVFISF
ncbi:MAG: hypothetical protein II359_06775 [Clostridia bacterium]|nr:hypothetical protein [Clostridia bacterium]